MSCIYAILGTAKHARHKVWLSLSLVPLTCLALLHAAWYGSTFPCGYECVVNGGTVNEDVPFA